MPGRELRTAQKVRVGGRSSRARRCYPTVCTWGIQIGLLPTIAFITGVRVTDKWLWLPIIWVLEIVFRCGLAPATSSLNVFIRDTRYVVESFNRVLFWLQIFYSFDVVPSQFRDVISTTRWRRWWWLCGR